MVVPLKHTSPQIVISGISAQAQTQTIMHLPVERIFAVGSARAGKKLRTSHATKRLSNVKKPVYAFLIVSWGDGFVK